MASECSAVSSREPTERNEIPINWDVEALLSPLTHPKLIDHFFFVDLEFGAGAQMV